MTNNYLNLIKYNLEKDINNNFIDVFNMINQNYSEFENQKFLKEKTDINLKVSPYHTYDDMEYLENGIIKTKVGIFDFLLLKLIENFKRLYALSKKHPLKLDNLNELNEQIIILISQITFCLSI